MWTTAPDEPARRAVKAPGPGPGAASGGDVVGDEPHEVGVAVDDLGLVAGLGWFLTGPGGLPGGSVTVEAAAGAGDPLAESVPGFGEVA